MARGKFRSTWVAFRATSPPGPLSMNGEGEIPKYLGCIPRNLTPWPPLHEWRGGNSDVLGLLSAHPNRLAPSPLLARVILGRGCNFCQFSATVVPILFIVR